MMALPHPAEFSQLREALASAHGELLELRRRHHAEISHLREALVSAHGELLELRRRHARGAAP